MQFITLISVVDFFSISIKLGLIISIMVIGVHISYRILNCADLGIEGIFPLGGCVCLLLMHFGVSPLVATLVSIIVGGIGGLITALLHTKLKIPMILSGIITLTGFYSINLLILGFSNSGSNQSITRASLSIKSGTSLFYKLVPLFNSWGMKQVYSLTLSTIIIMLIILAIVLVGIYYFFGTEIGMSIRATGDNPQMAKAQGINTDHMIIVGLILSNALIGLAGALFAQNMGTVSVVNGKGMIVVGLASIIIAEAIFGRRSYKLQLISIVCGTVIYYLMRQLSIVLNLSEFLDLASAILIVIILSYPLVKEKVHAHRQKRKGDANA